MSYCCQQSPACNVVCEGGQGTLKTANSNKSFFPSSLLCNHWSFTVLFFTIFYAGNISHTYIVSTLFMIFQCADGFIQEKSGCHNSRISKFFHCNSESSFVLNYHAILSAYLQITMSEILSIGWAARPLRTHTSGNIFHARLAYRHRRCLLFNSWLCAFQTTATYQFSWWDLLPHSPAWLLLFS